MIDPQLQAAIRESRDSRVTLRFSLEGKSTCDLTWLCVTGKPMGAEDLCRQCFAYARGVLMKAQPTDHLTTLVCSETRPSFGADC